MNSINFANLCSVVFDNVYMLFIVIPLLAVLLIPFFIAVRRDNRNGHNIASMALHVLMAVLIAFAAAGTQIVSVITKTEVYVVADVSFSANKNLDTVDNYIENLSRDLPAQTKLGVVTFGKDYELFAQPGARIKSVKESKVDDTETNLSAALNYTNSLFQSDVMKRIIVITDGKQSYETGAELRRTVANLQAQNVRVDAIYLDDNLPAGSKEVQISSVTYTPSVFLDSMEEVCVFVQSSYVMERGERATVTLACEGKQPMTESKSLSVGYNTFFFYPDTDEAGKFDYTVTVTCQQDELDLNNTYTFTQEVHDDFNVLVLTSSWKEGLQIIETYGEGVNVDLYENDSSVNDREKQHYVSSLGEDSNVVIHMNDLNVPYTVGDLCKYDEFVLNEFDLTEIYNGTEMYGIFIENLKTAVTQFGKGLVTFGDLGIQNKSEGELRELDKMLPVSFGKATDEGKLYTLVFDFSRSMSYASRLSLAKLSAIELVNSLSENDSVCIYLFAGGRERVIDSTKLAGGGKEKIINTIRSITLSDLRQGTLAGKALDAARKYLCGNGSEAGLVSSFSEIHTILITDGLDFEGTVDEEIAVGDERTDKMIAQEAVEYMYAYGIRTTAISVGNLGLDGLSPDDVAWIDDLVALCRGKHYHIDSELQIPGIIVGGVQDDLGSAVITQEQFVTVERALDGVLSGVVLGGKHRNDPTSGYVDRYVLSVAKTSAKTVLSVDYNPSTNSVAVPVPLLAYRTDNGTIVSYTGSFSQLKRPGGVLATDNSVLFSNIFNLCAPEEKNDCPFTVTTQAEGKMMKINLNSMDLDPATPTEIRVIAPDGTETVDKLAFNSTNYSYDLAMTQVGKYAVSLSYTYGGTFTKEIFIDLPYEPEYDAFTVYDASVLYSMLAGDGEVSEDGDLKITVNSDEVATYVLKLTVPFLILSVVLFVADVIVRKLKWNDIVSLFRRNNRRKGGNP